MILWLASCSSPPSSPSSAIVPQTKTAGRFSLPGGFALPAHGSTFGPQRLPRRKQRKRFRGCSGEFCAQGMTTVRGCRSITGACESVSSVHAYNCHGGVIGLASSRKLVHGCKDRVDNVVSALCLFFGCCLSETLCSPLVAGRIYRFNHPVSVGEDQIAGIELNRPWLIGRIRKYSDGQATGSKPNDRAVSSNDHRGIVAGINILQPARCSIKNAIE